VDLRDQAVENADPIAAGEEFGGYEAADETGAARDEDGLAHTADLIEFMAPVRLNVLVRCIRCVTPCNIPTILIVRPIATPAQQRFFFFVPARWLDSRPAGT
jgi:hypothetical protein